MFKKKIEKKPKYPVNWYADKFQTSMVWRNWLLLVVLLSLLSVLFLTAAAMFFVPLKTVKPFVIQVDEKTGNTEVVNSKSVKELSGEEALFKFFAMNYIRSWENYSIVPNFDEQKSLLEYNIEFLRLMSAPQIFSQYRGYISPENPQSPINLFSDKIQRQVFFRTFIVKTNLDNDGLATIQANVDVLESGFNTYNSYSMVIEMTGGFNPEYANSLSEKERRLNPLGFRVISYRSERVTR